MKQIIDSKVVEGIELQSILKRNVDSITPEDTCFNSIDVKMDDFNVLMTNNCYRFRPRVICIETCDDPASGKAFRISELLHKNQFKIGVDLK